MTTNILGQYIGFWFGTLTAIFFFLAFLTCRILPARIIRAWGKWWNPVHKFAWAGALISATLHITLITLGFVFGVWI